VEIHSLGRKADAEQRKKGSERSFVTALKSRDRLIFILQVELKHQQHVNYGTLSELK